MYNWLVLNPHLVAHLLITKSSTAQLYFLEGDEILYKVGPRADRYKWSGTGPLQMAFKINGFHRGSFHPKIVGDISPYLCHWFLGPPCSLREGNFHPQVT